MQVVELRPPPDVESALLRLARQPQSLLLDSADYTVGELAAAAGVSVANASQHLRRLEAGGILGRRRIGNTVQYRVVETSIEQLCAIVCASVQERARVLVPADTID